MAEELPVPLSCADRPHITMLCGDAPGAPHLTSRLWPPHLTSLPGALSSEHTLRTHLRAQAHGG